MKDGVYELPSRDAFCQRAAELIGAAAEEAVRERGRFLLVLTGGRTVQPIYRYMADGAGTSLQKLLRTQTYYFWGDERWVPETHPDSNQGLARRLFLDDLNVKSELLLPVATNLLDLASGARAYEEDLQEFFADDLSTGGGPVFDLVLLGLGPDGHVASLFPGSSALAEERRWVSKVSSPELPPRVGRVTLTLPVLNRARLVVLLAAGAERVKLARKIIAGTPAAGSYPAARLRPAGNLVWLLAEG